MSRLRRLLDGTKTKLERRFLLGGLYRRVFESEEGKVVLEDLLQRFGFADRSTCVFQGVAEPAIASAYFEGQRSVWIHIQRRLHMSETEMRELRAESVREAS